MKIKFVKPFRAANTFPKSVYGLGDIESVEVSVGKSLISDGWATKLTKREMELETKYVDLETK